MSSTPKRGAFHTDGMPHRCASVFSHPLEWLFRRHGQVGYALLTRSPVYSEAEAPFPPDLHVLGTPPAFVLSQDQTLHRKKTLAFLPFSFLPLPQLPPSTTAPRNGKDQNPTVRSDKKHSFNEQILLFIVFPPMQCRENSGKESKATYLYGFALGTPDAAVVADWKMFRMFRKKKRGNRRER